MNLKKIGKAFTNKLVGTGPSSYKKIIFRAAVSQKVRNTAVEGYYDTRWLTAFWSAQAKVEGIVLKAARHWVVTAVP